LTSRLCPGAAALAASGLLSQPSASAIVVVIEDWVFEFVPRNWAASSAKDLTGERCRNPVTSRFASSGLPIQRCTSDICLPPRAAACRSTARARRAWASQNSRSPEPAFDAAETMSVARSAAVFGSVQPVSGSNVTVEAIPPNPTALNTYTGPLRARSGPHRLSRSVRVEVTTTAPGASMIRPANHPVLPVRGPPNTIVTSSIDAQMVCNPVRHSSIAYSMVGTRHRARRLASASDGRTLRAFPRIARPDAVREIVVADAVPELRRERPDQRVTTAAERVR